MSIVLLSMMAEMFSASTLKKMQVRVWRHRFDGYKKGKYGTLPANCQRAGGVNTAGMRRSTEKRGGGHDGGGADWLV